MSSYSNNAGKVLANIRLPAFSMNPKFAERACCLNGTDSQCITDCRRALRGIFAAGSAAHQRKVLIINDVRSSDARREFRVQRT